MPRAAARRAAHSSTFCRSPPTTSCPSHLASGPLFLTHKRTNLLLCVDRSPCAAAGYAGYFSTTARIKDKRTPLEAALANVGRCGNDAMHTAASRDCWLGNANDGAHAAPGTACLLFGCLALVFLCNSHTVCGISGSALPAHPCLLLRLCRDTATLPPPTHSVPAWRPWSCWRR